MSTQDDDHLKILSILNYVLGGLGILGGLFPAIYIVLGLVMALNPEAMQGNGEPPPPALGWMFVGIGACGMLFGLAAGVLTILNGRFLSQRRRWVYCFVVACLQCLQVPLGTCLGVFTIIVLSRDSVKQQFGRLS